MTNTSASPEHRAHADEIKPGSERSFGLVFTAVFALIAIFPVIKGSEPRFWAGALAAVFLGLALVAPSVLMPLNRIWFLFGLALHKVVNPVVMGFLFFFVISPIGLLMRATGNDPLRRRFDKKSDSYWIHRAPPGPAPQSMKNQF